MAERAPRVVGMARRTDRALRLEVFGRAKRVLKESSLQGLRVNIRSLS